VLRCMLCCRLGLHIALYQVLSCRRVHMQESLLLLLHLGVLPFTYMCCDTNLQQDRAFNDRRYYIGSSKLGSLGWTERTSWEEGLQKTIDW